jgi:hypothetical protein
MILCKVKFISTFYIVIPRYHSPYLLYSVSFIFVIQSNQYGIHPAYNCHAFNVELDLLLAPPCFFVSLEP